MLRQPARESAKPAPRANTKARLARSLSFELLDNFAGSWGQPLWNTYVDPNQQIASSSGEAPRQATAA